MSRQNWQLWRGDIPAETCDNLVELMLRYPVQDGKIFKDNQDSEHRKSKIRWIEDQPGINHLLWQKVREANRNAFNVDVTDYCQIQFTEYSDEYGGCYNWHHDIDWNDDKGFDRKLSIVVQLTDGSSYEGGNLEFDEVQNPHTLQLRKKGSVIVFPSYLRHRVTPVTSGLRHSLVAWFEGPRWR
jgi:PKHD-type hydroxylase